MGRIQLLDDSLVDQIAAGEVVERPSSVVKELLENALDAEATHIQVDIVEGGRERIRIADDGVGMSAEDALMAIRRHATSKLRKFEDLSELLTMGFRGEALPSIASVSRFRLLTRQRDEVSGTEVRVEGGGEPQSRPAGCPVGTTIEVDDLFFNVPARRKFLKARQTETSHVKDTCLRIALAHPTLRLVLQVDGRRAREYLPAPDRFARAKKIFGGDFEAQPISGSRDGIEIEAALGPDTAARTGMRRLYLFVNNRPIVDRALARSIAMAYGDRLEGGRYPSGAVWLHLPPAEVDVNAHPQKTEVRFAHARRVYDAALRIIAAGLETRTWGGGIEGSSAEGSAPRDALLPRHEGFWSERLGAAPRDTDVDPPGSGALASALRDEEAVYAPAPTLPERPAAKSGPKREEPAQSAELAEALSLLANGLVVAKSDAALLVIEPRRLASLVTQRRLSGDKRSLLFPERVELDEHDTARLEAHREELSAQGVEVSMVGPQTAAVHAVPDAPLNDQASLLGQTSAEAIVRAALGALENGTDVRAAIAQTAAPPSSLAAAKTLIAAATEEELALASRRFPLEELARSLR